MTRSILHRRRCALASFVLPAIAYAIFPDVVGAQGEEPTRRPRMSASAGVMAGVPGLGAGSGRAAGLLSAQVAFEGGSRFGGTIGASYARAGAASRWCVPIGHDAESTTDCFTYDQEAVLVTVGSEYTFRQAPVRLALSADVGGGFYHEVRRGSITGFTPSPTRWHAMGPVVGAGVSAGRRIGPRVEALLTLRVVALLTATAFGAAPTPQPAITLGLRW